MSYKILIVDDEPMLTALLCDHLGDNGYITFAANSAEDAVSLPEKAPDLILLDINMPGINGLELCKSMRGHVSLVSARRIPYHRKKTKNTPNPTISLKTANTASPSLSSPRSETTKIPRKW